ncbi:MAG: PhoH family protein [Acidobacteriota bacterium]
MGMLEIEALTYIRGRSIPQQYLVIDEAQNSRRTRSRPSTRVGEGSKVVLAGRSRPDRQPLRRRLEQRPLPTPSTASRARRSPATSPSSREMFRSPSLPRISCSQRPGRNAASLGVRG